VSFASHIIHRPSARFRYGFDIKPSRESTRVGLASPPNPRLGRMGGVVTLSLANGSWLTVGRVRRVAAICGVGSVALILWLAITSRGTLDWQGRPLGTDFSDVWAAGKMALDGHAADAWNWNKHFAVQRSLHGPHLTELYAWHYPPPFLLLASTLALLPYVPALLGWQLVTLVPFVKVMHRLVTGRDTLLLTLAAPATLLCLTQGQNGFLTALLMTGGLMLLDRRPIAAGLLLGCLIYKPQFGLVLPVVLVIGRHWRAVGGAFVSASILIGTTLALWGWSVWQAFINSLSITRTMVVEHSAAGFFKIMSPFAAVRMWGGSISLAYSVQSVFTAAAIAAVFGISLGSSRTEVRNATVCAAAVVATPYVLDYDLVVLLPALAWLYADGRRHGFRSWDGTIMAVVWMAPLFARGAAQLLYIPVGMISAAAVGVIALRRVLDGKSAAIGYVHPGREQQIRQP
jgi:Glycosyltransferase family 87